MAIGLPADDEQYSRFLHGDTAAYDGLLIRHGDALTRYLYGYLHSWEDAEDLMIEAFARIMVKRPRIGAGCFHAYLYRTARNLATRFHERSRRAQVFSLEGMEEELADEARTDARLLTEEREKILHLCLERIDPELREALWLIYFEEMSYAEAADVMGVNTKRVDHLLTRAKRHLREELEKEGVTDAHE